MKWNHFICPSCSHDFYDTDDYATCSACQRHFYASESKTCKRFVPQGGQTIYPAQQPMFISPDPGIMLTPQPQASANIDYSRGPHLFTSSARLWK